MDRTALRPARFTCGGACGSGCNTVGAVVIGGMLISSIIPVTFILGRGVNYRRQRMSVSNSFSSFGVIRLRLYSSPALRIASATVGYG